jgi:uncharacterized protein (TIGR03086 family)
MDEISLLSSVMDKTGGIVAGVGDDQSDRPTPCPDYDVAALVDHIVGWVQAFEAGAHLREFDRDPSAYSADEAGVDPVGDFRTAADSLVAAWREHGVDRQVRGTDGGETDGTMTFNMTLMEYTTHGWDLAVATDQPVPFTEAEAQAVLDRAEATLPARYRGGEMPFGDIVDIPATAPAIDRLVAFMGRHPDALPPSSS